MSLVSVLMTTYNSATYVEQSIKSILNQDHKDFELIIVDDFSEDDTIKVIDKINDKRVKLYKNKIKGRGSALNYGLELSNSKFIALNDSDDISVSNRLSRQLDYLKNRSSNNVVSSNFACFKDNKLLYEVKNPEHSEEIKSSLAMHCKIMNSGVIYSREHILKYGGYENSIAEDYLLWLKIMKDTEFYNIQDVLMFVRLDLNSLSVVDDQNFKEKNRAVYNIQDNYIDYSEQNNNLTAKELNVLKGWRDFFYGSRVNARGNWRKAGFSVLNPRILSAYIMTYFPQSILVKFKSSMLKYRIKYYINYFSIRNKKLRTLFKSTMKNVS